MAKAAINTIVPQTCGCGVSGVFRTTGGGTPIKDLVNAGGAGWHIASFTNEYEHSETYKEAYKELRDKWQIVFQGRVRTNTRTGHKFILCVYDTNMPAADIDNSKYKWPKLTMGV